MGLLVQHRRTPGTAIAPGTAHTPAFRIRAAGKHSILNHPNSHIAERNVIDVEKKRQSPNQTGQHAPTGMFHRETGWKAVLVEVRLINGELTVW